MASCEDDMPRDDPFGECQQRVYLASIFESVHIAEVAQANERALEERLADAEDEWKNRVEDEEDEDAFLEEGEKEATDEGAKSRIKDLLTYFLEACNKLVGTLTCDDIDIRKVKVTESVAQETWGLRNHELGDLKSEKYDHTTLYNLADVIRKVMSGSGGHEPTNHLWILQRLDRQNNDNAKHQYISYCKQHLVAFTTSLFQQVANETKKDLWKEFDLAKQEHDLAKQKVDHQWAVFVHWTIFFLTTPATSQEDEIQLKSTSW